MFSLSQSLPLLFLRPAFPLEPVVLVAVETRRILPGLLRRSAKRRTRSRAPGIHLLCFDVVLAAGVTSAGDSPDLQNTSAASPVRVMVT